jgi:3,4-dihydroxy 2-butanone 4-phosphate synthase/GTP cyclohydrolase II
VQDGGVDTVAAQVELGLPVDARDYAAATAILHDLGVGAVRLLTNNPTKIAAVRSAGIDIATVERLQVAPVSTNAAYLRTKRDVLGHDLVLDTHDSTEATA